MQKRVSDSSISSECRRAIASGRSMSPTPYSTREPKRTPSRPARPRLVVIWMTPLAACEP
jgi:hypothetical protein